MRAELIRSSPAILTFLGITGAIGTAIMAVNATPKALERIREDSRRNHGGNPEAFTKLEAVQSGWKYYIPSVLMGLSTIVCIAWISVMHKRNQAALASAYAMLNETYRQYRETAKKIYGNDSDARIQAEMAKEVYVSSDGLSVYDNDMESDNEKTLFYDMYSKRYFSSTIAAVLNAQYHINRNLQLRGYTTVNEFYDFLGLEEVE